MNDPKLVREVMANKFGHFQKRKHTGIVRRLSNGLVNHEGEKWAAHRKIINPAFHLEKLKVATFTSTSDADATLLFMLVLRRIQSTPDICRRI